ncbi:MAG: sulfite exporter TauE/SafE family protein [Candidatus Zixiibacteriota bacterium]
MEIWTGFLVGLVGSLHCIGMCGPIVAALPQGDGGRMAFLGGRLLYNGGRVISYALMGLIFGLIGKSIFLAGYQQGLSIAIGVLIILAVILPAHYLQRAISIAGLGKVYALISRMWAGLFRSSKGSSLFAIGILNGFLPCGFVYVGIAGALATGGALSGAGYMALFGAGTIPIMLAFAFVGNVVGAKFRRGFSRAVPVLAVALAVVFILRGLSLGIPIISPEMSYNAATGKTTSSCCEQHK